MTHNFAGKTAVITGASNGVGLSVAKLFCNSGANVVLADSDESALEEEVKLLRKQGHQVLDFCGDLTRKLTLTNLIAATIDEFETIDILVNNAGITKDNLVLRLSEEDFDHVLNTNLKSVFHLTKLVSKPMMKQKKGSIINIIIRLTTLVHSPITCSLNITI